MSLRRFQAGPRVLALGCISALDWQSNSRLSFKKGSVPSRPETGEKMCHEFIPCLECDPVSNACGCPEGRSQETGNCEGVPTVASIPELNRGAERGRWCVQWVVSRTAGHLRLEVESSSPYIPRECPNMRTRMPSIDASAHCLRILLTLPVDLVFPCHNPQPCHTLPHPRATSNTSPKLKAPCRLAVTHHLARTVGLSTAHECVSHFYLFHDGILDQRHQRSCPERHTFLLL